MCLVTELLLYGDTCCETAVKLLILIWSLKAWSNRILPRLSSAFVRELVVHQGSRIVEENFVEDEDRPT